MKYSITLQYAAVIVAILIAFGVAVMPAFADHSSGAEGATHTTTVAHDEEADHDEAEHEESGSLSEAERIEKMQALITLLTQLIELLTHQIEHQSSGTGDVSQDHVDDDDVHDEGVEETGADDHHDE